MTAVEINAARTPAGGWTKAQLAEWGVPWPPPKGWKRQLITARSEGGNTRLPRAEELRDSAVKGAVSFSHERWR